MKAVYSRVTIGPFAGMGVVMFLLLLSSVTAAGVLPDDRTDVLFHSYSGGGVNVSGPSLLIRKKLLDDVSFSANYYVDMVSSASIDVVTTASPYSEERTQYSVGADYLHDNTTISVGYVNSSESDYQANTANISISQDFFGDLTTVTVGYAKGWDTVGKNGQANFSREVRRQNYQFGLTQIITRNLIMTAAMEGITDEGFLNNPYRSVRYFDPTTAIGYSYQPELYPETRTSTTAVLGGRYFLPYRAALHGEYKFFTDTWGIDAQSMEFGYTHPYNEHLTLEFVLRHYQQGKANFYADLFPFQDAQNFLARDKELSTFTSDSLELGATYEITLNWHGLEKGTINLSYNYIQFKYDDFRNLTVAATPGTEPLYDFNANVIRAYISFWY